MADFKTHWQVGAFVSVGASLVSSWANWIPPQMIPMVAFAGLLGSIIPDIDSNTSKPLRLIFGGMAVICPPLLIWQIPFFHIHTERVILVWALGSFLIAVPLKGIFKKCTLHRGAFHSLPAACIFGEWIYLFTTRISFDEWSRYTIGGVAMIGYLTHLLLDEIWSVDFNGIFIKKKRSLGTAFSFSGASLSSTVILYLSFFLSSWVSWKTTQGFSIYESLNFAWIQWI